MDRDERILELAALFLEAGRAHHEAFAAVDGEDADWAIWYATYLHDRLNQRLRTELSTQEIAYRLMEAEHERRDIAPERPWHEYWAEFFAERHLPEEEETLALYHYQGCFWCERVRRVIRRLDIDVEYRDIFADPQHRQDLVEARGRPTVPVLRCTSRTADRWMPESRDIIAYLEERFG